MSITGILVIFFIIISAFFSASETALFSLGKMRLRRLQDKFSSAKIIKYLLKKPAHLLSTIVFGNMLVNIGLASLSAVFFVNIFKEKGIFFSIFFSGVIILFLGEIFPKILSIYTAERFSLICAPILNIFSKIFFPIVFILKYLSTGLTSLFVHHKKNILFTEEELKTALYLGKKEGAISEAEEEMISCVLKFKDTSASQIMTPRVEVKAIDIDSTSLEVKSTLKKEMHSKFPVYKESMDNIKGILYSKDVFLNPDKDWKIFIREPIFIPESKKIDDILTEFIKRKERIAVVLDEYGGTSGIITFEDIVEEIFGELYDEYEFPQEILQEIGPKTYRVFAKAPIKTVNLELNINLPEGEDTIAGFILNYLERIPQEGEKFLFSNNIEFIIERATRRRLLSVIVKLL